MVECDTDAPFADSHESASFISASFCSFLEEMDESRLLFLDG